MKILFQALLFLLMATVSSSCFEIVEEVQINENGSGHFTLTLNMSESKVKLHSIMMLDSVQGFKVPHKSDIQQQLNSIRKQLSSIAGITNVQTQFDFDEYMGSIRFNFTHTQQINTAMKAIMEAYHIKDYSIPHYQYNASQRHFSRTFVTQPRTLTRYNQLKQESKDVLQQARYTAIFRFNKEINTSENTAARISKNKKAVMQQTSLHQVITRNRTINQNITLVQ